MLPLLPNSFYCRLSNTVILQSQVRGYLVPKVYELLQGYLVPKVYECLHTVCTKYNESNPISTVYYEYTTEGSSSRGLVYIIFKVSDL